MGNDLFNLLAITSLILIRRHRGMKRPGPTLHVLLRETGSTDCVLATLPHRDLQGYEDALSLYLSLLVSPRLTLVIGRKILNYYYDPQQWYQS